MDANEIKFRAWHRVAREWHYFTIAKLLKARATDWGTYYTDWSQCAGVKDKDTGVEIYDGDIVTAAWHWTEPHTIKLPDDYYSFSEFSLSDELTIIGNAQHPKN